MAVPYGCYRKQASLKKPDGGTGNEIHTAVSRSLVRPKATSPSPPASDSSNTRRRQGSSGGENAGWKMGSGCVGLLLVRLLFLRSTHVVISPQGNSFQANVKRFLDLINLLILVVVFYPDR